MTDKDRSNKLFIIGAGPGPQKTISLESLLCLKKSDVVILDVNAERALKGFLAGKLLLRKGDSSARMCGLAVGHLKRGKNVCFVSSGNPFLFTSHGQALARACAAAGFRAVVQSAQSSLDQLFCLVRTGFSEATGFHVATLESVSSGRALDPDVPVFLLCLDKSLRDKAEARKLARALLVFYKPSHRIEALHSDGFRAAFPLAELPSFSGRIPLQSSLYIPPRRN